MYYGTPICYHILCYTISCFISNRLAYAWYNTLALEDKFHFLPIISNKTYFVTGVVFRGGQLYQVIVKDNRHYVDCPIQWPLVGDYASLLLLLHPALNKIMGYEYIYVHVYDMTWLVR